MTNAISFGHQHFNGPHYDHELDHSRLTGQIQRVYRTVITGDWVTLGEIEKMTGDPQASISAQLRHLRKERFGSHRVHLRRRGKRENGLWEYCLHKSTCNCVLCWALEVMQ